MGFLKLDESNTIDVYKNHKMFKDFIENHNKSQEDFIKNLKQKDFINISLIN